MTAWHGGNRGDGAGGHGAGGESRGDLGCDVGALLYCGDGEEEEEEEDDYSRFWLLSSTLYDINQTRVDTWPTGSKLARPPRCHMTFCRYGFVEFHNDLYTILSLYHSDDPAPIFPLGPVKQ